MHGVRLRYWVESRPSPERARTATCRPTLEVRLAATVGRSGLGWTPPRRPRIACRRCLDRSRRLHLPGCELSSHFGRANNSFAFVSTASKHVAKKSRQATGSKARWIDSSALQTVERQHWVTTSLCVLSTHRMRLRALPAKRGRRASDRRCPQRRTLRRASVSAGSIPPQCVARRSGISTGSSTSAGMSPVETGDLVDHGEPRGNSAASESAARRHLRAGLRHWPPRIHLILNDPLTAASSSRHRKR